MPAANDTIHNNQFTVCPGCDLLVHNIQPPPDHTVLCPRCRHRLHRRHPNSVQRTLALAATGLLLYLPANFYPLLTFDLLGTDTSSSLVSSTLSILEQGQHIVGLTVLLTGFVFPLLTLSLLFWVSAGLLLDWKARWMPGFLRCYQHLTEWAMLDVYLIGVFVTIVKMSHTAEIQFNVGFFCFIALVMSTVAAQASIDKGLFWQQLEGDREGPREKMTFSIPTDSLTGKEAGLVLCHTCHKTMPVSEPGRQKNPNCPRCGASMHLRKHNSVGRTWALIVTAALLTLPANLLPIMEVEYFGQPEASTIMDGIIYFFQEGSYGIGAIILTASILVPLFKISGMTLILLSIHFQWTRGLRHKAFMFRFIEFIGRWSMLDIFVITLLCALVQFGYLSTINVAPAAFYFTGVVLSTMFAAISFDRRLLWDTVTTPPPCKEELHGTTCAS
jgi:paraquat-inducible protein A